MAGHDASESRSSTEPVPDFRLACDQTDRPPRIGLLQEFFLTKAVPEVRKHTEDTAERFAAAGAGDFGPKLRETIRTGCIIPAI